MHSTDLSSLGKRVALGFVSIAVATAMAFGLTVGQGEAHSGGLGSSSLTADSGKKSKKKKKARTFTGKGSPLARKYARLWSKVSKKNKRWARKTAQCESGGNPKAIGYNGLYRGAFQFMLSTWRTSPKSPGGDPIRYTYKTQAYVAVRLKMRDGAGHWPNCG